MNLYLTACGKRVDGRLKMGKKNECKEPKFKKCIHLGEELSLQNFRLQYGVSDCQYDKY